MFIPEHLLQSLETERRLTTPAQLPTLTRLDQDMKQIIECPLPEDQKVFLLDQLLQRYQGLTNQMKTETTIKPTMVLLKADPLPTTDTSGKNDVRTPKETSTNPDLDTFKSKSTKAPRKLLATLRTRESKIPRWKKMTSLVSPEEMSLPLMSDTPPDSARKSSRRKPRTTIAARLRRNRQWEPC